MPLSVVLKRPQNGISLGHKFTITALENFTAAVAEVLDLSITAGATADTNVSVTLRGATPVVIAVANLDTAAQVATKISGGTFPGWTTSIVSTTHVRFTSTTTGVKTGANTYTPGTSGTTGSFSVITLGAVQIGGDILFDARKNGVGTFKYSLVAHVTIRASDGTIPSVSNVVITYPVDGQIRVQGQFATGQIIDLLCSPTVSDTFIYSP